MQVVHARDIYQSSIDAAFKNPQCHHRLLRLNLTDGHTEVLAIEYTPIPSISEVIVPGTKVPCHDSLYHLFSISNARKGRILDVHV